MYRPRFLYLYALLVAVAAAFLVAAAYKVAVQDTRTVTVTKAAPGLTATSTVEDVRARFDQQPETMPGDQAGQAVAQSCPQVDVYQAADGAVLICHA